MMYEKEDILAGVAGGLTAWWGGVPMIIQATLMLAVVDVLTGLGRGVVTKTLGSDKGSKGFIKKAMALLLLATGWIMQHKMGVPFPVTETLAGFLCGTELISIVENCKQAGIEMPEKITQYFTALNGGGKDVNQR